MTRLRLTRVVRAASLAGSRGAAAVAGARGARPAASEGFVRAARAACEAARSAGGASSNAFACGPSARARPPRPRPPATPTWRSIPLSACADRRRPRRPGCSSARSMRANERRGRPHEKARRSLLSSGRSPPVCAERRLLVENGRASASTGVGDRRGRRAPPRSRTARRSAIRSSTSIGFER